VDIVVAAQGREIHSLGQQGRSCTEGKVPSELGALWEIDSPSENPSSGMRPTIGRKMAWGWVKEQGSGCVRSTMRRSVPLQWEGSGICFNSCRAVSGSRC
jgi:hypothetical protein